MWSIARVAYKKGGGTTNVQSYQPTEQEIRLQEIAADYAESVQPNAGKLNQAAADMFFDSLADTKVDFNELMQNAQNQTSAAQQGVANLAQGQLPQEYIDNMTSVIQGGVENSLGSAVSSLANRGVLSSSVSNNAINNISKNAADTMASQYLNNINTLNGLYGQQANMAGNNITIAAGAQEAAQSPAMNAWNMSMGLGQTSNGALQAIGKNGTTTTTTSGGGGNGFLGALTGLGSAAIGAWCFTDNTKIKTPEGEKFIRNIKVGDDVICHNETGDTVEKVTYVQEPVYTMTYAVMCKTEGDTKNVVYTTLTQPLLTEKEGFVDVGLLKINTKLKGVGKVIAIVESGERNVYDFACTGNNNYYANKFVAKGSDKGVA